MSDRRPEEDIAATASAPADGPAPALPSDGPSLVEKTATGMGWVVGWRAMTRLMGLVSSLILVRLLAPADFGLVALATTFVLSIDSLSFIGVEDAVVRERNPDRGAYDTAFTLNALRGLATALLVAALAQPVAAFFEEPRLANVLYALAVAAFLGGFENVGVLQFRRDLAFHKEFQMQMLPRLVSIIATLTTAAIFRSYWALVVGIMTNRILRNLMTYTMHPHRPRLTIQRWREMTGFSLGTWAVSLALLLRDRTDNFVLGRLLGTAAVGIYSLGAEIGMMPVLELAMPLCRAIYSSFSVIRNDGGRVDAIYVRFAASTQFLVMPACIGLALVADPLVRLAFGPQWLAAIPLIVLTGVTGPSVVFGLLSRTLLEAYGHLTASFWVVMTFWVLRVPAMVWATSEHGLIGGVIASVIVLAGEQIVGTVVTCRRFGIGARALFVRMWRIVLASLVMAAVVWTSGLARSSSGWHLSPTMALVNAAILGALVYTCVVLLLWGVCGRPQGAESDMLEVLRRMVRRFIRWPRIA